MSYRDYNDYELLSYVQEDSEEANEILFQKYQPLIEMTAKRFFQYCKHVGLDLNDFIQEGMLGLNAAIQTFSEEKDATFYTYAKTCIERRLISVVVGSKRQKHKILNESLSLEIYNENDEAIDFDKLLVDNSYNPESVVLDYEQENELIQKIEETLTPLEQQVFELKISGFSYREIASILDRNIKTIDNALHRIKLKVKNYLDYNK